MTLKRITGEHGVSGDWDSERGNQVLIYFHPNGRDATYFAMDGIDYSGGIDKILETRDQLEMRLTEGHIFCDLVALNDWLQEQRK